MKEELNSHFTKPMLCVSIFYQFFVRGLFSLCSRIHYLFSSSGASFDSAMEYCDEQYYYELGKKLKEDKQ